MKKILLNIIISFPLWGAGGFLYAQKTEGVVHFEYQVNWIKMIKKLPYLTQEEKDRMENTWKNDVDSKQKMNLYFNEKQSIYTWGQDQQEYEGSQYKGRNEELVLHKNFETEKHINMIEMLGKTYLVQDSLRKPLRTERQKEFVFWYFL